LDLDGGYLAAVEIDHGRITRAVSSELPSRAIVDGEVADAAALTEALREFFTRTGLPKNVRLGIANQQIAVRTLKMPPIPAGAERDAAVRFMAADAIAMPLDDAVLDYEIVGETVADDGSTQLKAVVVAVRKSMVSDLAEAVRAAGLKPMGVDLNAFAVVRMLADPATSTSEAEVYCHLGEVVNLAVAIGDTCVFARPLSPVKDESGVPLATSLAEDIRLSIDFYMAQDEAVPVRKVWLCGPGAATDGLATDLATALGVDVSVAPALGHLEASLDAGEDPARHTVAAGLAIGGVR
jgi:type IV pilus assembly protein PilM